MTSIPVKDFDIEFIERTQKLISNYKGETEFSLLLNCLLGLIIIPNQFNQNKQLKFLKKEITQIPEIWNSLQKCESFIFNPTKRERGVKPINYISDKKTLRVLLKKIKNALSHIETIKPINDEGKWIGIKIIDINSDTKRTELECDLRYNQIKHLAEYISTEYQRERLKI